MSHSYGNGRVSPPPPPSLMDTCAMKALPRPFEFAIVESSCITAHSLVSPLYSLLYLPCAPFRAFGTKTSEVLLLLYRHIRPRGFVRPLTEMSV
jgi:hypothetical protein